MSEDDYDVRENPDEDREDSEEAFHNVCAYGQCYNNYDVDYEDDTTEETFSSASDDDDDEDSDDQDNDVEIGRNSAINSSGVHQDNLDFQFGKFSWFCPCL